MSPDQMMKMLCSIQSVDAPEPVFTKDLQEIVDYIEATQKLGLQLSQIHRRVSRVMHENVIDMCLQCQERYPCATMAAAIDNFRGRFPPLRKICPECNGGEEDGCFGCHSTGWVIA